MLPSADKAIFKLMKSYFNIYSGKLEKKVTTRRSRLRVRARRSSTNRMLVSRPELKHTGDKVIVTVYVYNRINKYYINKTNRVTTIDQINNLIPVELAESIEGSIGKIPWPSTVIMRVILKEASKVISIVKNQKKRFLLLKKNLLYLQKKQKDNETYIDKMYNHEIKYLKYYVSKSLRKEIFSLYFRQLMYFNKSKFDERYLKPLTELVNKVYNKKIEFNFVNLKYLYLNSSIFSDTLVRKIRNRKNRLLRVLKTSLLMFKLPDINRSALYDEIYNRKRKPQNLSILDTIVLSRDTEKGEPDLDGSPSPSMHIVDSVFNSIKYKRVSGIRLEAAGRLTRRYTAERSVFKLRYKGNIRNADSSFKGLSAVLMRGHAKSNSQYSRVKSELRIGSFSLKA